MLIMVVLIGGTGGTTMKTKLANTGPTGWYHLCSIKSRGLPPVSPVPPKKERKRTRYPHELWTASCGSPWNESAKGTHPMAMI